jgi:hypothetical protein
MSERRELVCVRRCQGLLLAELYRSKLTASGIPALLQYESAGPVFGLTVDGLGEVALMVPAEMAAEAYELLEDIEAEEPLDGTLVDGTPGEGENNEL